MTDFASIPKVLVLGGTTEGKALVTRLLELGVPVVYSIAGLVRMPEFATTATPYEILHGGFQQFGGLARYLQQARILGVCDATHPFAEKMSATAWAKCRELAIPYWRYQRPEWPKHSEDDWTSFKTWPALLSALPLNKRIFFSAGQLNQETHRWLQMHSDPSIRHLWRTAVFVENDRTSGRKTAPQVDLPINLEVTEAIGPFDLKSERQLFLDHQIDVLVTKNSGGDATYAKIRVARELFVPVLMIDRPQPVPDKACYSDLDKLILLIVSQLKLNNMMAH